MCPLTCPGPVDSFNTIAYALDEVRLNLGVMRDGVPEAIPADVVSKVCQRGGDILPGDTWPASLEGFAKRAHEFFEVELKPVLIANQIRTYW